MEILKDLSYNPDTGKFIWINPSKYHSNLLGQEAGYETDKGYIYISYKGKAYPAHRLVFLFMEEFIPSEVDHKNGNKSDNRYKNLRVCNRKENVWNTSCRSNNLLGLKHIRKTRENTYQVRINGKSLGCFKTKEKAIATRNIFLVKNRNSYNEWMIRELDENNEPRRFIIDG